MRIAVVLAMIATPALAGIDEVIDDHILPGQARLVTETTALAEVALLDCSTETVRPAYHSAYDAWIAISHIQFGPIEDQALSLAMSFWPDPKNSTGKALGRLVLAQDPIVDDLAAWGEVSAAAQGFTALERLLYEDQQDPTYACRLTRAIAKGLSDKATLLFDAWPSFADEMRASQAGSGRFQSEEEVQRTLFTALSTGLEFLHDQRLGRPMGTFERPRPRKAEARRSERSLRHVVLALDALEHLAVTLSDNDLPKTRAAFAEARARAAALDDPVFADVADPAGRFKVEVLQQSVAEVQEAVIKEIGMPLGIQAGFNALDGD